MAGTKSDGRSTDDLTAVERIAAVAKFCRENGVHREDSLAAILDAAIELTHADMGNIQLVDSSGELVIAAHRGFDEEFLTFFARVSDAKTACGVALSTREAVIVEDVATSEVFVETPGLGFMLRAGALAVQSTPLTSSDGKVVGMISTHFRRPHRPTPGELASVALLAGIAADHLEHGKTRKIARWSADALQTLLDILPIPASIATDVECRSIRSNSATAALYGVGRTENLSQSAAEGGDGVLVPHYLDGRLLRPDELPMQRAAATGEPQRDAILDFVLPNGERGTISATAAPLFDDSGTVIGAVGAFADITALRRAQEGQAILAREIQHRGNNLLAVVQAIAHRSFADARDLDEAKSKLEMRLEALGRVNRLLLRSHDKGVMLREIVDVAMAPFAARTQVFGEDVWVGPMQVQNLSIALHELATNSIKYGALSNSDGAIRINWRREVRQAPPIVRFGWSEAGGPVVIAPTREGQGTRLLRSLYKDVQLSFLNSGLRCEMALPINL